MASNTNKENMNSTRLMCILDEHKENVGDGAYLELCNAIAKLNTEDTKVDTMGFYRVKYVYVKMIEIEEDFIARPVVCDNEILHLCQCEADVCEADTLNIKTVHVTKCN